MTAVSLGTEPPPTVPQVASVFVTISPYIFKSDTGTHINDGANSMLFIVSDFL